MDVEQYFAYKSQVEDTLLRRGFVKLPKQTWKTHFLHMKGMEYWKLGPMIAGVREIKPTNNKKWLLFYRHQGDKKC